MNRRGRFSHVPVRVAKPSDWGFRVTVCIAAIVDCETKIQIVTDSKVSYGDHSSDAGMTKNFTLCPQYGAMFAGNDIVYAAPTLKRAKSYIYKAQMTDPDQIAGVLHAELVRTRTMKVEAKILSKLGYTLETFKRDGKAELTDNVFYDLSNRIDREELSLDFIVFGFDENQAPHLRVVTADEPPQDYDEIGFTAIGSGANSARSSLSFAVDHGSFGKAMGEHQAASYLLAAKFMSESATDVGRSTFFSSLSSDMTFKFIWNLGGIEAIRAAWEKTGAPRRSKAVEAILKDVLWGGHAGGYDHTVMERCLKYTRPSLKRPVKKLLVALRKQRESKEAANKVLEGVSSSGNE